MTQLSAKRTAARVRWQLEEYTLGRKGLLRGGGRKIKVAFLPGFAYNRNTRRRERRKREFIHQKRQRRGSPDDEERRDRRFGGCVFAPCSARVTQSEICGRPQNRGAVSRVSDKGTARFALNKKTQPVGKGRTAKTLPGLLAAREF